MAFKVYSGPAGTDAVSPIQKDRMLFKEFPNFDEALSWASHVKETGRVAVLIEDETGAGPSTSAKSRRHLRIATRVTCVGSRRTAGRWVRYLRILRRGPAKGTLPDRGDSPDVRLAVGIAARTWSDARLQAPVEPLVVQRAAHGP